MPPQRFEYQPCIISQFKGPHLHEVGVKRYAAHESGTLRLESLFIPVASRRVGGIPAWVLGIDCAAGAVVAAKGVVSYLR